MSERYLVYRATSDAVCPLLILGTVEADHHLAAGAIASVLYDESVGVSTSWFAPHSFGLALDIDARADRREDSAVARVTRTRRWVGYIMRAIDPLFPKHPSTGET